MVNDTIHIPKSAPQFIPGSGSLAFDGIFSSFLHSYQIKTYCKLSFQSGPQAEETKLVLTSILTGFWPENSFMTEEN